MNVKLLTEHYLEFLSLEVDCTMPHCWKSHVMAHIINNNINNNNYVCVGTLRLSQQVFSHDRTLCSLPVLNQYEAEGNVP